jgi:hypothetical protein
MASAKAVKPADAASCHDATASSDGQHAEKMEMAAIM